MLVKLKEDSVQVLNTFCSFCTRSSVIKIREEYRDKFENRTGRHYITGFFGSKEDKECTVILYKYLKLCLQSDSYNICMDCLLESINQVKLFSFKEKNNEANSE